MRSEVGGVSLKREDHFQVKNPYYFISYKISLYIANIYISIVVYFLYRTRNIVGTRLESRSINYRHGNINETTTRLSSIYIYTARTVSFVFSPFTDEKRNFLFSFSLERRIALLPSSYTYYMIQWLVSSSNLRVSGVWLRTNVRIQNEEEVNKQKEKWEKGKKIRDRRRPTQAERGLGRWMILHVPFIRIRDI